MIHHERLHILLIAHKTTAQYSYNNPNVSLILTACSLEMTKSIRSQTIKRIQKRSESQNGKGKKRNQENKTVAQET